MYVIDRKLFFNPENGSLKSMKNEKEVFLSNLNARIFSYLLEQGVKPVSREAIFKAVWSEQAQGVSSATLNQYISLTRRALIAVGFNERLIITVAKTGYRINKTIEIKLLGNEVPALEPNDPVAEDSIVLPAPKNNLFLIWLRILSIMLPLFFLLFCYSYYKDNKENEKNIALSYVGVVNGCPIYYSGKFLDNKADDYLAFLTRHDLYGKQCGNDEVIITRADFSLNKVEESGRQFIAKCIVNKNGTYHDCKSEYIRVWK